MEKSDFFAAIGALETARDKNGEPLRMLNVTASDRHVTYSHDFVTSDAGRVDLRSVSKVVLALTVGEAIRREVELWGTSRITLDTPIHPLLERCVPGFRSLDHSPAWERVTLHHLLTNSIGHQEGFLFRKDIGSRSMDQLLAYIVSVPISHEPGDHFSYSNVGPYLISALLREGAGIDLDSLASELVLQPLGIADFTWARYGPYVAGCTGLEMTAPDLHKIGRLIADGGVLNGMTVVNSAWIDLMKTPMIASPDKFEPHRALPKMAYGYCLWVTPLGNVYCDGTAGQYLIVRPENGLVITTTGLQDDMKPITECLRPLLESI